MTACCATPGRRQAALLPPGPFVDPLRDIVSNLMDLPEVKIYFGRMMTGLGIRYDLPYAPPVGRGLVGTHIADFVVDDRTLYSLARDGRPLLLHTEWVAGAARMAAPWGDRVYVVSAATLGRSDLTAVLVRPDGVVASGRGPRCAAGPGAAAHRAAHLGGSRT